MNGDSNSSMSAECSDSNSNLEYGPEPYKDPETLQELYHEREYSQSQIADQFNVTQQTICYWFDRFDIESRPPMHERDPSISVTCREDGKVQFKVPDSDGGRIYFYRHQLVALLAEDEEGEWQYGLGDVFADDTHVHHEMISGLSIDISCNLSVLGDGEHIRLHVGGGGESHVEEVLAEMFDDYDGEPDQAAIRLAEELDDWQSKSARIRAWQSRSYESEGEVWQADV